MMMLGKETLKEYYDELETALKDDNSEQSRAILSDFKSVCENFDTLNPMELYDKLGSMLKHVEHTQINEGNENDDDEKAIKDEMIQIATRALNVYELVRIKNNGR